MTYKERKQVFDKLFPRLKGPDHVRKDRLCVGVVVVERPATEGYHELDSGVALLHLGEG